LDKEEAVQYVLDNPPPELKRLRNLESVIETSLRITSNQFTIGRFLPRGGVLLWFSKEVACNRDAIQIMEGAVAKKVRNSIEEAKKSVILYRVSLWFDLDKFVDVLGEDLASYRRFTKKGSAEETETDPATRSDAERVLEIMRPMTTLSKTRQSNVPFAGMSRPSMPALGEKVHPRKH